MADFLLGALPVVSGNAELCRTGAWTAEVMLATTSSPPQAGDVTTLTLAGRERLCAVVSVGSDYLQTKCRLVAGRGHLDSPLLDPRDYRGYQAAQIAQDALQDAGEVPGGWDSLEVYCAHWTRTQAPCRESLQRLMRLAVVPELRWRVLDDGTVDAVVDDFGEVSATDRDVAALGSWGQERLLLLGVQNTDIVPGSSVSAFGQLRSVDRVVYRFDASNFTAMVYYL